MDELEDMGVKFFESFGYYDTHGTNSVEAFVTCSSLDSIWGSRLSSPLYSVCSEEQDDIDEELEVEKEIISDAIYSMQNELEQYRKDILKLYSPADGLPLSISLSPTDIPSRKRSMFLPPFSGYLMQHKEKGLHRWRKRWFHLDFTTHELWYYKRRDFKVPKGCIRLDAIRAVHPHGKSDFDVDHGPGRVLSLRAKTAEERQIWMNLLCFGLRNSVNDDTEGERLSVVDIVNRASLQAA